MNRPHITTVIPVYNGQPFIGQTLDSIAAQTLQPNRVVVIDDGSTDATPDIVRNFKPIPCEYLRNPSNMGVIKNYNRALDFAVETDYLQILHADDLILPAFYEVMVGLLEDCPGQGLAWALDERIDENNKVLNVSGKPDGRITVYTRDEFLRRKAELANQAFCSTLYKTNRQPIVARYRPELLILNDTMFYAEFGADCRKQVQINRALGQYRWHGSNTTSAYAPAIQSLILDEWEVMQRVEALRGGTSALRQMKLKGLFAVRSGIKAKRFRTLQKNPEYAEKIVDATRKVTGLPLWLAGQMLVEIRDLVIYKILGRPQHPKNIYG
ncbi:MAG TPA: glycosyltransferase family 2 protein [Desulfuromonadaceae bacterium]|nr:glycosyltransferase family 2 protein [Desulfuromonadaceae bacterium]